MAAGLGFKTFNTGDVLTANDTNGYLMQGVLVFDDAAARDAAITAPAEGQFAYLKDTNVTTYYTGSAWDNLDSAGMTNPMTTTGDIIYSSPGSTPARLGVGATDDVLTVAGGVPTWAAPAAGSLTLITTQTFSAVASQSINDVFSASYDNYLILLNISASAGNDITLRTRVGGADLTGNDYNWQRLAADNISISASRSSNTSSMRIGIVRSDETLINVSIGNVFATKSTSFINQCLDNSTTTPAILNVYGNVNNSTSYTGFTIFVASGTISGTARVYGYKN